ncbi:MAG: YajQ family cyclic di-GMP-binding protein [Gammaproteobacteria bacterium]|nr:YajQ family cyclic di-GMP-binding protein [Gammaproteobacteria bacterium]MCP5199430.1 YajQ family cyclic di-GMP-binding protein [Gammaproteobacteria bacterium]
MPSFDVVSEIDKHELANAVDQAVRELGQRFDFKGTKARFEHDDKLITLVAESEFQTRQMLDILHGKFAKRGLDINCLELGQVASNVAETRQPVTVREGIDKDLARKLVKQIKDSKLKVQAQVQQEQVRVSGKNRDDLQKVMALLREADIDYPLQFTNFRD